MFVLVVTSYIVLSCFSIENILFVFRRLSSQLIDSYIICIMCCVCIAQCRILVQPNLDVYSGQSKFGLFAGWRGEEENIAPRPYKIIISYGILFVSVLNFAFKAYNNTMYNAQVPILFCIEVIIHINNCVCVPTRLLPI